MEFSQAIENVKKVLEKIGSIIKPEEYDGLIVKRLETSNTLDDNRTTKQSHIAITGSQMDMFPYVRADGYFEVEYEQEDADLKKYFVAQVPAYLHKENVEYLGGSSSISNPNELVHISIVRSRRNNAADQIQMSMINMDSPKFIEFRRMVHEGSYLIMLKRKRQLFYDVFAVKAEDIDSDGISLSAMNNMFCKTATNTTVKLNEILVADKQANFGKSKNEYELAAEVLTSHLKSQNINFLTEKADAEKARDEFMNRFSPEKLKNLLGDEILNKIFYTQGDNTESLCYWIEQNKECKNNFGSISGGSAYKFGLFQKQENGKWATGSPIKPKELSHAEALALGTQIRDTLVKGAEIIQEAKLETIEEYEELDQALRNAVRDQSVDYEWAWFHKYFSILFPQKFSSYHSGDWQYHVLRSLKIKPSKKFYVRSGQIAMVQKYRGWWYCQFASVFYDKFGNIKKFLRLGSSNESKGYASEWKKNSEVAIGWPNIGSLEEYRDEDGRLDKNSISSKLQEIYYPDDAKIASRKAGELLRFYASDKDTIFVVANGERLIGLVDDIGTYQYDDSSDMAHVKPGKWHCLFNEGDTMPEKSEGLMTSCIQIKNEENLMYLYEKYYYGNNSFLEDNLKDEENMKNCLEIKREPRKNKDFPLNVIIYGAPGTGKTYGTAEYALRIAETPVPNDRKELMTAYNDLVRKGRIVFTTFHQNYGYEEFIQGLRPDIKSEQMAFKTVDGVFKRIADRALNDDKNNYVIIIDEINRANISKVFGELITLIEDDKRWGEVNETCATLQSGDIFAVPNNLYIVGTMNSADKSISLIDAALRRRFSFKEQRPNADLILDPALKSVFTKLNSHLSNALGSSDLLIGHSYFMGKAKTDLSEILNNNIVPLLYEYFYDNKKNVFKALVESIDGLNIEVVDDKIGRLYVKEKAE